MAREKAEVGYTFPYLYDESQEVAKAYQAACTPDFFVFDREQKLVYRGQMDGSRPGNSVPVTGRDLRAALDAVARGQADRHRSEAQPRLQHQVEAGQRAGVLPLKKPPGESQRGFPSSALMALRIESGTGTGVLVL